MNESNESSWRDLYRAAVLESNSGLFQVRVNEALAAINARASDGHWVPRDERIDMDEARSTLRGLKSRGWQSKVRGSRWIGVYRPGTLARSIEVFLIRSQEMFETTWRDLYRAAILELNPSLLKARLKAAEDAIVARASDARAPREERKEMDDALSTLHRLKKIDS
jgi:hypothetical protein